MYKKTPPSENRQNVHQYAKNGQIDKILEMMEKVRAVGRVAEHVLDERDGLMGATPLHFAAEADQTEVVRFLLDRGAPVEARDSYGLAPIHSAASKGNTECVKMIAGQGASPSCADRNGDTPLHYAATMDGGTHGPEKVQRHVDTCALLLKLGCSIDAPNKKGWTATHRAAFNGRTEVLQLLLNRGANPSSVNDEGNTPLHLACMGNRIDCAQMLIAAGSRPNLANAHGRIPSEVTKNQGLKMLLERADELNRSRRKDVRTIYAQPTLPQKALRDLHDEAESGSEPATPATPTPAPAPAPAASKTGMLAAGGDSKKKSALELELEQAGPEGRELFGRMRATSLKRMASNISKKVIEDVPLPGVERETAEEELAKLSLDQALVTDADGFPAEPDGLAGWSQQDL
ncbi:unnamed protein product [Pedinophyceae sp. YPF-701]|nr:unnamed protein product [Pedinophyceae sp. YPF-701]